MQFKIDANKPNELYTLLGVVKGKNKYVKKKWQNTTKRN